MRPLSLVVEFCPQNCKNHVDVGSWGYGLVVDLSVLG